MDIGAFLRQQRDRRGLTQDQLAVRAGIPQTTISRYERGNRVPSLRMVEKILAAMGLQLRWEAEPLWADVDAQIAAMNTLSMDDRVRRLRVMMPQLLDDLGGYDPLLDGACAALLQGAPVPATGLEIAVPEGDFDRFADAIAGAWSLERWSDAWKRFGSVDRDPRVEGGPMHWESPFGEVRARIIPAEPVHVTIVVEGRPCRIRPLADIESDDPWVARVLERMRTSAVQSV